MMYVLASIIGDGTRASPYRAGVPRRAGVRVSAIITSDANGAPVYPTAVVRLSCEWSTVQALRAKLSAKLGDTDLDRGALLAQLPASAAEAQSLLDDLARLASLRASPFSELSAVEARAVLESRGEPLFTEMVDGDH